MLHLVKPWQTKILAQSSCSKPGCLQTQTPDSPILFPWINTPGMCHAWMLADSSCSCRYPCFQCREGWSGSVHSSCTSKPPGGSWCWGQVCPKDHFAVFLMLLCFCHFLGMHRVAACVKSLLPGQQYKSCVGSGCGFLALFPAPWCWLWVPGEVWEQEESTLVTVGTVGFNTRMCGPFSFPTRVAINTLPNLEICCQ